MTNFSPEFPTLPSQDLTSPIEKEPFTSDARRAMLREVNDIVINRGMTRQEYDERKNRFVAPGWTVKNLIGAGLDSGQIKWDGDTLIFLNKKSETGV